MRSGTALSLVLAGLAATTPAMGRETLPPTGYEQISAGNLTGAVRLLEAERVTHPDMPELMLNLAAAYIKIGRRDEARALYARTLAVPAVNMDMPSGQLRSSYAVAQRGLALLDTVPVLASR